MPSSHLVAIPTRILLMKYHLFGNDFAHPRLSFHMVNFMTTQSD